MIIMKTLWGTRKCFLSLAISISAGEHKDPLKRIVRTLVAAFLAGALAAGSVSPAFAQSPAQNPAQSPAQSPVQNPPANPAPAPQAPIPPVSSLGLAEHDFSRGPSAFPNLFRPYRPIGLEPPVLANSPRIEQLIHDGKLSITLQDAIELALENSLDIAVQRYYPWTADTDILKTSAGGFGRGTPGASINSSTASVPSLSYDPLVTGTVLLDDRNAPVNNPFISGTGQSVATAAHIITHTDEYNSQFFRGFETGSTLSVVFNNTRSSSTATANFFNPVVQSTLSAVFSQQLLNGAGLYVNRRNIMISKNNRKVADWAFAQQAITAITNTITAYWELVYARENVKVEQQAVAVSEKLYSDNKKQLQAGTMAPLDVTRAQSQLATDRQNLIVAQTVQLQDEQILKNAISKDPMAPSLVNVEIIPTDEPTPPAAVENPSFEDSVKEAYAKRPEIQEQLYNVKNAEIDVRATRNALLPELTLSAQYASVGLAGNSPIKSAIPTFGASTNPIVDSTGTPVIVNGGQIFVPVVTTPVVGTSQQGLGDSLSQVFQGRFPEYLGQLTLTLPLRNRSAQADNARALLVQRQLETQMQQLKNAALLDVRNSYIALTQGRASVEAASEARQLQQETFDAEQKKYRLGASTTYNVILTLRDLISAQGTEIRALANLEEAKANYERALGRTLEVNHVTIADALSGEIERETRIPGTLHGRVVGTEKLFDDGSGR
jgi:outer membrane protein